MNVLGLLLHLRGKFFLAAGFLLSLQEFALFFPACIAHLFYFLCRKGREFKVAIKFASKPDIHHLKQFLAGRQMDAPQETIQVLDIVLRAAPSEKY